jgi:3-dehydroquinate synthetase
MDILVMDKKRNDDKIDFIVLKNIGNATIETISFDVVRKAIDNFSYAGNR